MNWCKLSYPLKVYESDANSEETSKHLFDPWSFDHMTAAVFQMIFIPPFGTGTYTTVDWATVSGCGQFSIQWYVVNLTLHTMFEVIENTEYVIRKCRNGNSEMIYTGDTFINTIGDLISFTVAYISSHFLLQCVGWWTIPLYIVILQAVAFQTGGGVINFYILRSKSLQKEGNLTSVL